MGFNTTILVMNDRLTGIEKDPENFVWDLCRLAGSGQAVGPVPVDFHSSQSSVIVTHHADRTAVILVGGNTATVLGTHGGWRHSDPEGQVACLRTVLAPLGYEVRKMPKSRLGRALRWAKSELETQRGFDPSKRENQSVPHRRYRKWERKTKFLESRVKHLENLFHSTGDRED